MNAAVRRWAVVPAAGRGERFGGRIPKQYAMLHGRPVIAWSVAALLAERSIARVLVVLAKGDRRWRSIAESRDPRVSTCVGGERREHSVANALAALAGVARERDWVIVHDAARPCLRREDLRSLLAATRADPVGGLLAVPVSDTLKKLGAGGRSERTVPRDGLWRALTPQVFRYGLLARAMGLCIERDRIVTDEASAIEALGLRPLLVRGHADNVKVTEADDRDLAEAILRTRAAA